MKLSVKALIGAVIALACFSSPAAATQKSPAAIKTQAAAWFAVNGVRAIGPDKVLQTVVDIADSFGALTQPNTWTSTQTFQAMPVFSAASGCYLKANGAAPVTCEYVVGGGSGGGPSLRTGFGAPNNGVGVDGDWYVAQANYALFGPKANGAWPGAGVSLVGPQGPAGAMGAAGPAGVAGAAGSDGKTILSGAGAPASGLGANGDFYIDTAAWSIYGPKASGAWGTSASLIGPQGPAGAGGESGPPSNGAHKAWRVICGRVLGGYDYFGLAAATFYDRSGTLIDIASEIGAGTAFYVIVSAYNGFGVDRLFDDNAATDYASQYPISQDGPSGFGFRRQAAVDVGSFTLTGHAGYNSRTPKDLALQYSDDGGYSWRTAAFYENVASFSAGETRTFAVPTIYLE